MEKIKTWLRNFLKGALEDILYENLEREAAETEEILLTLILLQFSGLENPFSFYGLELLPFLKVNEASLRRLVMKEERLGILFSRFEGWA